MNQGQAGALALVQQRLGAVAAGLSASELLRLANRARRLVRSGAASNIREAAYRVAARIRGEAQRPRTASTLAQRIGVGPEMMTDPRPKRSGEALLPPYKVQRVAAKPEKDRGGYTQIEYSRDAAGSRLNKVQRVMKSLASQIYSKIERCQYLGTSESGDGAYKLAMEQAGSAPNITRSLPYYFFDLTSMEQRVGTVNYYPNTLLRLQYNDATDQYQWIPRELRNADDTGSIYTWSTEVGVRPTPTSGDSKATFSCFHDWVDVNLMLFGARRFPTRVQVSIVQFIDELLVPDSFVTTAANAVGSAIETSCQSLTGVDKEKYRDFYLSLTSPSVAHPLGRKGRTKVGSMMKTLYSKTFEFNPTTNDEVDARGHQNLFKFRYYMNKVCRYDEYPADPVEGVADGELIDPDEFPQYDLNNDTSCFTVPKGRVFLMISGYAPKNLTAAPVDFYDFASFDLQVRRKTNHLHGITAGV